MRAEDGGDGVEAMNCAGMNDGAESDSQSSRGDGFGSQPLEGAHDFNDRIARADELDVGFALWAYYCWRTKSAFAACGRLHVGDPIEETCFVCDQRARARISPS